VRIMKASMLTSTRSLRQIGRILLYAQHDQRNDHAGCRDTEMIIVTMYHINDDQAVTEKKIATYPKRYVFLRTSLSFDFLNNMEGPSVRH